MDPKLEKSVLPFEMEKDGEPPEHMRLLVLGALGVVFGDIGTSPLYALRECFLGPHGLPPTPLDVLGLLSLLIWCLILLVSIKYLGFILRADNRGEGGILALMTLVRRGLAEKGRSSEVFVILGLFGAGLLFADAMITPAISVLSAVEGLTVATSFFTPYVLPISLGVLLGLFLIQRRGTARIGAIFGPVMLVWFLVMAALGVSSIAAEPSVLKALNPLHAVRFFAANHWKAFLVLGTVFLVMTGAEALYADLGHFGKRPIRLGWFIAVLPALVLNYLGQGAWLLRSPDMLSNLFYRLGPSWAIYPLVLLSTAATVIASQAVISGAFSLLRQSVQLGFSPRMTIVQTSSEKIGQIYMPGVNAALMIGTLILVLTFQQSGRLAAAYGVAVSATMLITTSFLYTVARRVWGWKRWTAAILAGVFLPMDCAFFSSNLMKLRTGGWLPLLVAGAIYLLMVTWRRGRVVLRKQLTERSVPEELFLQDLAGHKPVRVPGAAVFLSGSPDGVPSTFLHNYKHNKILHETIVILTVITEDVPYVSRNERIQVQELGAGMYRVTLRYGYFQAPNAPQALRSLKIGSTKFDIMNTSFFLGRETLVVAARSKSGMRKWQRRLFAFMSRNAMDPSKYFKIPPNRVVELGIQLEL